MSAKEIYEKFWTLTGQRRRGFARAHRIERPKPLRRQMPKVRRNQACICGGTLKYKECCGKRAEDARTKGLQGIRGKLARREVRARRKPGNV